MITIRLANESNAAVLALLGRITYVESHGHFIEDKKDLAKYTAKAFAVSTLKNDLNNPKINFYIIYSDDLPVGYAKVVFDTTHKSISSKKNVQLERIYILQDFIPLKLGQQLLLFVEKKAKDLALDTIWLTVYIKNKRAIRFYKKNKFTKVGEFNYLVNGKGYENLVLEKNI